MPPNLRMAARAVTLVLSIALAAPLCSAQIAPAAAWDPPADQAAKLGAPTGCADFTVQLPGGLTFRRDVKSHHRDIYSWLPDTPDKFADGGGEILVVPASPESHTLDAFTAYIGESVAPGIDKFVESPIEQGTVGGQGFLRCYWKGVRKADSAPVHGLTYFAISNGRQFIAEAHDIEPGNAVSLPLWEAAFRTLRVDPAPAWAPDADALAKATDQLFAFGYALRLPPLLHVTPAPAVGLAQLIAFRGEKGSDADGETADMAVQPIADALDYDDLEAHFRGTVSAMTANVGPMGYAYLTRGQIAGQPALRMVFGLDRSRCGVAYVLQDDKNAITIASVEPAGRDEIDEPVIEAGLLSVHKASAP